MTITPALIEDDDDFNALANRLARELSTAFGYTLPEAEQHIRAFYREYEESIPGRKLSLKKMGVEKEFDWTAVDLFFHEDSALVLHIGYRLAGGDTNSAMFLDWRKDCWQRLKSGERVSLPSF